MGLLIVPGFCCVRVGFLGFAGFVCLVDWFRWVFRWFCGGCELVVRVCICLVCFDLFGLFVYGFCSLCFMFDGVWVWLLGFAFCLLGFGVC